MRLCGPHCQSKSKIKNSDQLRIVIPFSSKMGSKVDTSPLPIMTPGHIAASLNRQFEFFENFDYRDKKEWMAQNWTVSLWFIGAYICAIFGGQLIMKERKAFALRNTLTLWNVALAIFSIMATVRTLPELITILFQPNGFHHSVCSSW